MHGIQEKINVHNYYSSVDDPVSGWVKTKKEYEPSKDYSKQ